MKDEEKTKKQLITELKEMQRRITELETSEPDRTQREEVLRESEGQYKTLIEHARDVIYTVSLDTTITSLSPAFEKITGLSRSEWIGKKIEEILHPDDRPLALEMVERLLDGKRPPIHEVRIRSKSSEYIPSEFNIAEQIKNGEVIGIIGIVRDISERKRVEDENRKFFSLIENSNEFVGLATLDGNPIYLNEAGLKLVGLDNLEEARTATIFDFVSENTRKKLVDEILPNVMEKGYYSGTDRLRHFRTKSKIDIEYTVFITKSPDTGAPENIAAVVTDISERIRTVEELRKHRKNLEQLVEERTGQLSKIIKQLQQEISDRKHLEDALRKISKAAIDFVELTLEVDPYEFICNKLKELVGDAIVGVNSFDSEQGILVTRKILGITEQKLEKVSELVGEKILGISFEDIDEEIKDKLFSGRLQEVEDRMYGIFFHQVPESTCLEVEKIVGIKDIHSIGFRRSGKLFGNASIFSLGDTKVNADIVETFTNLVSNVMERRHAEDALRESEKRFRTLIQRIQAAVVVHRVDTSIEMSNATAEGLLGLTEDQIMGKSAIDPVWKFFREDGTVMPTEEYPANQVVVSQKPLRDLIAGIYQPSTKDIVWVLVNADPVFDDHSRLSQIIVTFMDVTEHKRAQDALRENEEKLKDAQRMGKIGHWEFDIESREVTLSGQAFEIVERDPNKGPHEVKEVFSHFFEEDSERLSKNVTQAIESGESFEMDYKVKLPSGKSEHHYNTFHPIRDQSGNISKFRGTVQDITDLKKKEEELREKEYIIESSSSAIAITDLKGNMTYVNPAFLQIWGFDNAEELIGRPLPEFWVVEDKLNEIMQTLSGTGTWFGEIPAKRKDGILFDVQVSAATVFDKEGIPVALTSTSIDITERKQTEEERERLIIELQEAISKVKILSGMLPICTTCKKIRDDKGYWNRIEKYIMERSETEFSHSICPECAEKLYCDEDWYKKE